MAEYDAVNWEICNPRLLQKIENRLQDYCSSRYKDIPDRVLPVDPAVDASSADGQKALKVLAKQIRNLTREGNLNTKRTTEFYRKKIQGNIKKLLTDLLASQDDRDKAKQITDKETQVTYLKTGLMKQARRLETAGRMSDRTFHEYAGIDDNTWGILQHGVKHNNKDGVKCIRLSVPTEGTLLKLAVALRMTEEEMQDMLGKRYFSWLTYQDYVLLSALDYLRAGEQILIVDDMCWLLDFYSGKSGRYQSIYGGRKPDEKEQNRKTGKEELLSHIQTQQALAVEERINNTQADQNQSLSGKEIWIKFYARLKKADSATGAEKSDDGAASDPASLTVIRRYVHSDFWQDVLNPRLNELEQSTGQKESAFYTAVGLDQSRWHIIKFGWYSTGETKKSFGQQSEKNGKSASLARPSQAELLKLATALELSYVEIQELLGEQFSSWLELEDVLTLGVLDYFMEKHGGETGKKSETGEKNTIPDMHVSGGVLRSIPVEYVEAVQMELVPDSKS